MELTFWHICTGGLTVLSIVLAVLCIRARKTRVAAVQTLTHAEELPAPTARMLPESFDRLISQSSDIFFVLDENLRFVYVSANFQKLLKIDPVPLDNSPIMCYLSTESYIELKKNTSEAAFDVPVSFAAQLICSDHAIVHVNITLQKQNANFGVCFMGQIKTVKLKQEELNSDKNIYLQILEAVTTSVIITDINGVVVHANSAVCRKTGYTLQELTGHKARKTAAELIPNQTALWNTVKNGGTWQGEWQGTAKNGEKYWELVSVSPLFSKDGHISHYIAFKEDITTLKEKLSHLENTSKNLSEKVAMRDKLFSLISHDIRNCVGNLKNISTVLNEEINSATPNQELIAQYSTLISDNSTNTYVILENLLSWAKSQFVKAEVKKEIIDIEDIIRQNIEIFKNLAERKTIALKCETGNFTEVFADLRSVNAVVRNLITNAIKFSYPGSTINISVDEFSDDNNFAIISVADNGVGMTEEQKQHLFDNNSPSTTAGTQNEKGTGLGLLLCRDLVEKNGGKIWAKDNKPQGTVFCFTLSFA